MRSLSAAALAALLAAYPLVSNTGPALAAAGLTLPDAPAEGEGDTPPERPQAAPEGPRGEPRVAPPAPGAEAIDPKSVDPNAVDPKGLPEASRPRGPGAATDADPTSPEEKAKLLAALYVKLAAAKSVEEAQPIAGSIEHLWAFSGSATADLLAARAVAESQANKRDLALKLLDAAVEMQPDFAEAWNRRAFIHYLNSDYERALGDLRRVLALDPNHFKALDGLARILRDVGEKKGSLAAFKSLLAVHPQAPGAAEAVKELSVEVEGQGI